MRYKAFLIQEGRGKQIGEVETKKLLSKHCQKAMKSSYRGTPIYRGVDNSADYVFIDPKKGRPRYSSNTENYYTLINDNSPAWKKYPKRSESIICTTSQSYSMGYGSAFEVFPYDGANIGVAPERDYWNAFKALPKSIDVLLYFNDALERLFKQVDIKLTDDTFNKIQSSFDMFDLTFARDHESYEELLEGHDIMKGYDKTWDFMKHIQGFLNPKKNSFKLTKIGDETIPEQAEIWTDSKSIMVRYDWADVTIEELI